MTNGPHIRYLQLLPVYLQLSLVSPSPVSLAVPGILSYHRQVYVTDIEVHKARARSSSSSKPESLPILVLETVTFLLASIYRGFLARMRSHPRLVNPPRLGGNPRRGLARIVLVSHVCLHPSHP